MLIDLSNVLSEPHIILETEVPCTLDVFRTSPAAYPLTEKEDIYIRAEYKGEKELELHVRCRLAAEAPCDRCLTEVPVKLCLDYVKRVRLGDSEEEQSDEFDESNYVDGYTLDVDKLIYNEILIGWPTKILCSEDCKGICNVCGQNLNQGTCDCEDTGLDPRMSVIRDVFKNFKEV